MSHTWNDAGLEGCPARPGRDYKYWPSLSVVGVLVNMQHMFQQSLVLLSVHQQSGGHSSCMLILVPTVHTVLQTVDSSQVQFRLMVVDVPVVVQRQVPWLGAQKTVESPQLQWLGVVQILDKVVVPVGATTGGAQCLVRLWIHVPLYPGWLLEEFLRVSLLLGGLGS